jgi:hypothetical protein
VGKVVKGALFAGLILATAGAAAFAAPGLFATMGFWTFASNMAAGVFLSGVAAQVAGKARGSRAETGVEYTGTVEPRRIIYGELIVAGMHAIPPLTSGSDNRYLHSVLVIAGHEVSDITDVYFDRELIEDADIDPITGGHGDGLVNAGTFEDVAWIRRYLGTSSQTADYKLTFERPTEWTTDHRGRGVAHVDVQYDLDEEAYKSGRSEVMVRVFGKLCYDPRLDANPGDDPTNPSFIAYSNNPALCLADYITDADLGLGDDPARIDWDMVADAADICDELVDVPTGATQKRYTCNTALLATTPYENNIEALAASMLGSCLYSGGMWRIRAGAWEVPSFEITAANIVNGGIQVNTAYAYKDRWNGVRGSYVDPENFYQANEFPPVQDASYVSEDGESVFKDMAFPSTANVYEAQRNAIMIVRKSRNRRTAVIQCDLSMWKVRPGDTGIVTLEELGWVNKTVRCEGWKFNPVGTIELAVREELASDWDDPVEADYVEPLAITAPVPDYYVPAAPSALAAVGTPRAVNLSWTAPTLVPAGSEYEVYEYTSSTPFSSATMVWKGRATSCKLEKSDVTTRYYWVLLRTADGTAGAQHPTTTGVAGSALATFIVVSHEPANGTYGTGAISSSPGFTDNSAIATAAWTNNTGSTVTVEISYSITAKMNGSDATIFYRMFGRYNDGSNHSETVMNIPYSAVSDTYTTRSGLFTVSVADGVTITGTARLGLLCPSGSSATPPGVDYKDVKIRLTALVL